VAKRAIIKRLKARAKRIYLIDRILSANLRPLVARREGAASRSPPPFVDQTRPSRSFRFTVRRHQTHAANKLVGQLAFLCLF